MRTYIPYTRFGPGDATTWGRPAGHTLDPRNTWEPGEDAEEYCAASCPNRHGLECHRHSTDLEADEMGVLRCPPCYSARLDGLVN